MLKINASSVVVGAMLAVGAMLVMGQAGPQPQYVSWGPPKAGVVNVFLPGSTAVPPGGLVLYQVPPDRWLTVTYAKGFATGGSAMRIAEDLGGVITEKGYLYSSAPYGIDVSITGWVFRPGSSVVITNLAGAPYSLDAFNLIGYQTRD